MATAPATIPTTQSALQWVRVIDKDPFEWNTAAPVVQPADLGDQQVLLENFAASLNPIDYKLPAFNFTDTVLPASVGFDVSGRIVAVGKGVKDFHVGDEVFGLLNINPSNGGGAFQQYSVAEADTLVKKPANVSHENAAAIGVAVLSAWVSEIAARGFSFPVVREVWDITSFNSPRFTAPNASSPRHRRTRAFAFWRKFITLTRWSITAKTTCSNVF